MYLQSSHNHLEKTTHNTHSKNINLLRSIFKMAQGKLVTTMSGIAVSESSGDDTQNEYELLPNADNEENQSDGTVSSSHPQAVVERRC